MKRILIVKLGWSETLDPEVSFTSSLGDVLRTTVILRAFEGEEVTWLVDEKARQLVEGNPLIHRVLAFTPETRALLLAESFDSIVNLEKVSELCSLAAGIPARKRFGFGLDAASGEVRPLPGCERVYALCRDHEGKRVHREPWQKALFEIIGREWKGEEYVLGYQPKGPERFDFGLNHAVGPKWPTKTWPMAHWESLARQLESSGFTVSWQEGLRDLNYYMDWIHSCRHLITSDSLGLHLALALGKKPVVIYGPTNSHETYLYGRGIALEPEGLPCAPCLKAVCGEKTFCLDSLKPEKVYGAALRLLAQGQQRPCTPGDGFRARIENFL